MKCSAVGPEVDLAAVDRFVADYAEAAAYRGVAVAITRGDQVVHVAGHVHAYGASIPAAEPERFVAGSDGVITTIEDMARWLVVQSTGGRGPVSPGGVEAMHTPSDPRWTYGMGWETRGGRVRHSGIWFTDTAGQLLLPSGYGIAVLANSGVAPGNEGTGQLEDGLAAIVEAGAAPTASSPRLLIDLVLAARTALSLVLGVRALRRTRAWVRRSGHRPLRLAPRLVPLAVLVALPDLLGLLVGGGRDLTHVQLACYSVALVVWALVPSALNAAVLATRLVAPRRAARVPAG